MYQSLLPTRLFSCVQPSQRSSSLSSALRNHLNQPVFHPHTHPSHRFQSTMTIQPSEPVREGDQIPSGKFTYIPYTPELSSPTTCGNAINLSTDQWKGKKIVLFGVPGAFTKTCSVTHLPDFIKRVGDFKAKGVDRIYCIGSNDAFVMSAWGRLNGSNEHVEMISDATLEWLEKAGLILDLTSHELGKRSKRFALVINDLKVTYAGVEQGSEVSVSGADCVLRYMDLK